MAKQVTTTPKNDSVKRLKKPTEAEIKTAVSGLLTKLTASGMKMHQEPIKSIRWTERNNSGKRTVEVTITLRGTTD